MTDKNKDAFLALVKAGLWEKEAHLSQYGSIDFNEILRLSEEQAVVGLVAAGIEHVVGSKIPQEAALQFAGQTLQLEQRNQLMNGFIAELIERLRKEDIYCLLVKGQGVAQCYKRPLWRSCGDVDLLLSESNYESAKEYLIPLADHVDPEDNELKHLGMTLNDWVIELHGSMHTEISLRVNKGIEAIQDNLFIGGEVRSWDIGGTTVFLPAPDNDVILVFTHILEHFFIEGVGLRQVCDWCRLLWTYSTDLNVQLLESRVKRMGLMTEWKSFASLAIDMLGMPESVMPFYDSRFKKRGERVFARIMKSGNMGHNNDLSYRTRYTGAKYKMVSLWRRIKDFAAFTRIFPIDAPKFFVHYALRKI